MSAAASAAVTGVGAALFAMTKKFTAAEDRAAKFAKRLGIAVEELTALEFAGERSGISISQVDMSLQRLERRAAEAAAGMGEAQGALKELGIDARSFTQLGVEDKMALLAKQLEGVTDSATKTRLAFKLFDSEGVAMLQMLGEGEEAFKGLTAEARKFGAVISEQAAANAERFQDSLTNMTTVIGSTFRGISDKIVPIFTNLMDRITNFFLNNQETIQAWTDKAIRGFFTVLAIGERVFDGLSKTAEQFTTMEGFRDFATNYANAFKHIFESGLATFQALGNFIIDIFKVAFDSVIAVGEWAWENIKSVFTDAEAPDLASLLFERLPEATAKAREQLEKSTSEMVDSVVSHVDTIGGSIGNLLNIDLSGLEESIDGMSEKFQTFGELAEESTEPLVEATETVIERLNEMWGNFMEQQGTTFDFMVENLFSTIQNAVDGISKGIASAIVDGKNLLTTIKNIAKGVLKELIAMLIKWGVQRIATALLSKSANATEASSGGAKAVGLTFANTMASWAGAPWPISVAAPAMAAANAAIAASGFSAGIATGAGIGSSVAAAHGGLDYVPSEATYLLDRGERVLSPNQNRDFTNFIRGNEEGEIGSGLVIENLQIDVLPNATNAESFLSMDADELKEIVSEKIIVAMNELGREGIRPEYVKEF